jgi:putative protein-disulfide isomerase
LRYLPIIQVLYYTDPACPWSWALEPSLRKLQCVFGESLRFTYVMCGMAREFSDTQAQIGQSLEAGARSGMPVDPRIWLEGPPVSSFPACIAVKAAAEQGDPSAYLRRVREGLLCHRRKLDRAEALVEEARGAGLNVERFRIDLASHAILEAFGSDLEQVASVPAEHRAPGSERVRLPSLEFQAADGTVHGVYGFAAYEALQAKALAAGAQPSPAQPPSIEAAMAKFGSMATAEVAAVCELPGPRAPAELWRLASEWRLRAERLGSGELWSPA